MSLDRKLIVTVILIACSAIAAVCLVAWRYSASAVQSAEVKRLTESVGRDANLLQSKINMIRSDVTMLADGSARGVAEDTMRPALDGLQALADQLDALVKERPMYRQVRIVVASSTAPRVLLSVRSDGIVRTSIDPAVTGWDTAALLSEKQGVRPYRPRADSTTGSDSADKVLHLSAAVRNEMKEAIGAVSILADTRLLFQEFARTPNDIAMWIADADGTYIFERRAKENATDTAALSGRNAIGDFGLASSWERVVMSHQTDYAIDIQDEKTLLALSTVRIEPVDAPAQGHFLVVGGSTASVSLEHSLYSAWIAPSIMVLGIVIAMSIMLFLAIRKICSPLHRLQMIANQVADGDRSAGFEQLASSEARSIANAIARMARHLKQEGSVSERNAMGQMASMIAHDIRNSLSSVKMNLQILEEHHRTVGTKQIGNCEIALGQVRYMESVLSDMLTYAKPESVRFDWVDMGDILRTATIALHPESSAKSIELSFDGNAKFPTIMGDGSKLTQVFQNILSNAVFAAPEWGHIVVRCTCIMHQSKPSVEIRVSDDGPGIPPSLASKVFDPFFSTNPKGTGLGLAIVKKIVEQHDGKVFLDSGSEVGATVVVILPLGQSGESKEETQTP